MDIWLIVFIAFVFGATGGLTKLVDGKRDLSTRAYCGVLLSGGVAGLIIGLSTAGTFYAGYAALGHKIKEMNTDALLLSVIVSSSAAGFRGAKAAVDRVQIRTCKPQDGDQDNGSEV